MADLYRVASEQRAAILAMEREASAELVRSYGDTYQSIRSQVAALTTEMEAARKRGETVGPGWLAQRDRLSSLQRQVEQEISRFAETAEDLITAQQRSFVTLAREHLEAQALAGWETSHGSLGLSFNRLPTGAVQELVGVLADGSPLRSLLAQLGPSASKGVADGLTQGVALGQSTDQIARTIRAGLGGNLARAQSIARTETVRAYRESSRQTALQNIEIFKGWQWLASLGPRTCASCIAAHGSVHPLTERLNDHVRGRCTQIFLVRPLGGRDPNPIVERGPDWFARQPDELQHAILGPAKFAAFKDAKLSLEDLHGTVQSQRWGVSHPERSLREVLGEKAAAKYVQAAIMAA
jgi:SPP1 gp7 family putative phage head morphogenesis protein